MVEAIVRIITITIFIILSFLDIVGIMICISDWFESKTTNKT